MPLDIRSQVVTALDNINKNPELYTPPKPTTSLETRNGRYPEINSDRNELFEFLEKMPEKEFEEIIKRPYLRTRYLNDYLDRIGDLRNEELEDISFWKNLGVSKEPSKYWDSKMKYAIGNIPVMLGFGLYNNFNDERNDNWNSR